MSVASYQVELDIFSGPLDLLLYLVRRNEVEIRDLPVAPITTQFLEYIAILEAIDLDLAGDFLVVASSLAEIKSRLVLPQAEDPSEPELDADPRSDLIQQLLEYKKFKDAANSLEEQAASWQEHYPRLTDDRPQSARDVSADRIKEVELWDLVSALDRILKQQKAEVTSLIRYDDTPISVYVEQIGSHVREVGRVAFTSLFESETVRSTIIGMFLALLELLRHQGFRAEQSEFHGEIWLLPPAGDATDRSASPQEDPSPAVTDDTDPPTVD